MLQLLFERPYKLVIKNRIMKTNILSLVVIVLMAGTIVTGCGAAAKRDVKSAEGNIKEANEDLDWARKNAQEELRATAKTDWEEFKDESETAIEERNIQIAELREDISGINQDLQKELTVKLDKLELKKDGLKERLVQRNEKLKENLAEFDESARVVQNEFVKLFVSDMNELIASLSNLFKNNIE